MLLSVHRGAERVGEITIVGESVEFRLLDAYRARYPRPILGQVFEDDPDRVHRSRVKLPPFFSNLLPEGALRDLLAKQIGVNAEREPYLLAHVGEDLPGAVRVQVEDDSDDDQAPRPAGAHEDEGTVLKFSLAGVQLKLSAVRAAGRGLTIPAHGRGGDWIVKLPDARFHGVPENEWAMMTLARAAGLVVADVELVSIADIEGLPKDLGVDTAAKALAVKRFDRESGARIHIEDFAQVLDVRPSHHDKYHAANFETLARIVSRVAPESTEEFVRRLAFNVAIGNGDAHVKNWSLRYADPMRALLSPAYDIVSTIQYLPDDDLGLNFARSKAFSDVTSQSFARLGEKAELAIDAVEVAKSTIARVRAAWVEHRRDLPLAEAAKDRIEEHWKRIPLMSE